MFRQKYLKKLDLDENATEEDIKKRYKEVALLNHPDKLGNLSEEEQIYRENVFRESTEAYQKLLDKDAIRTDELLGSFGFTESMFENLGLDDNMMGEFQNIYMNAGKLFETYNSMVIPFQTSVKISFYDYLTKKKMKKDISIYGINMKIDIDCNEFPCQTVLKNMNGFKTKIMIEMELEEHDKFDHVIRKRGEIDLIYPLGLNHYQFYNGIQSSVENIDGSFVNFKTRPCSDKKIRIRNKGLNGGDMIIKIIVVNPKAAYMNRLNNEENEQFLKLLSKLYSNESNT